MSSGLELSMLAYSWDVLDLGVERTGAVVRELGCNSLVINSSYHHARLFEPQLKKVRDIREAAVSFHPTWSQYKRLKPHVHQNVADEQVLVKARDWCRANDLHFSTWWVGLHNSTLGQANPDLCVKNVWGDTYGYSLCPSQPDVQYFAKTLFEDTLAQIQPERILVESAAFLPFVHGQHHELALVEFGDAAQWLLSLCFCDACQCCAKNEGVDAGAVQALVRDLLQGILQEDMGYAKQEAYQISYLLVEFPEIAQYQRSLLSSVTKLVHQLSDIAHRQQVGFDFIPSSIPFSVNQAFIEGVSVRQVSSIVDRFIPLAYGEDASSVQHTLRSLQIVNPAADVGVTFSLHRNLVKSAIDLEQRVRFAVENGVSSIFYYNLGLLNQQRMDWIRSANKPLL